MPAEDMRDMDVTRVSPRWSRMTVLGLGTAAGLVFALPVKTGSVACPPAHEGRTYCLVQHAWAPAAIKLAAALLVSWLLADLLLVRLPQMRARWRAGERLARHATDHGRDAVLGDSVLAAANWGIVPEPSRQISWRAVKPAPSPAAAAALRTPPAPEPVAPRIPAPGPPPAPAPPIFAGVRALTTAERRAQPPAGRVRVLTAESQRTRRLRLGNDPALVVSCWSDASSARSLPDELSAPVSA
jgi:hypothetical protein